MVTKAAGLESQLLLYSSQNSLGMTVCKHINIDFSLLCMYMPAWSPYFPTSMFLVEVTRRLTPPKYLKI